MNITKISDFIKILENLSDDRLFILALGNNERDEKISDLENVICEKYYVIENAQILDLSSDSNADILIKDLDYELYNSFYKDSGKSDEEIKEMYEDEDWEIANLIILE